MVRMVILAAAALVSAACSVAPRPQQTPLWELAGRKVHVVVTETPPGEIHRDGGDWFYHELVTDQRDKLMIAFVASVAPQIADVADAFAVKLRERGLDAVVSDPSILPEQPELRMETVSEATRIIRVGPRPSAEIEEFVLILAIQNWGVRRDYAGVIPVGLHAAYFQADATLLDPRNPLIPLWSTLAEGKRSIARQWNEPPDFPKVHEALELALEDAVGKLTAAFFAWDGVPYLPGRPQTRL